MNWDQRLFRRIPGKFDLPYAINKKKEVRYVEGVRNPKIVNLNAGSKVELSRAGVMESYDVNELLKQTTEAWKKGDPLKKSDANA